VEACRPLAGRVALVTGAGRGLGAAIAEALAGAGAAVACAARAAAAGQATADAIRSRGGKAVAVALDVTRSEAVTAAVAETARVLGDVDVLVNNAGVVLDRPTLEVSDADWDTVLTTNLTAMFRLARAVAPAMIARGHGKIVNTASMLSFQGGINVPGYTASKSAIAGLTKALANEWASAGLNVNAVAPGYVATANTEAIRDDAERSESILARIPAGRWAQAADIAGAVLFLSSRASDYVNGAILPVDGGWLAR